MDAIEKRAREVLADVHAQAGWPGCAKEILLGENKFDILHDLAIAAIIATITQAEILESQLKAVIEVSEIAQRRADRAAITPPEGEPLSESDKDVALAQAVELAEYVERQAKGAMVDAAKRFLSLPYAQELAQRLTLPQGYVLVPVEPTEEMLDAGRAAVMAEHCAGPKWTPRQHFEASGRSTAGIPEDVLDERGPLTKESTAAMVFGAMLAARPEVP